MATRMTINGISTCTEAGTEKYERFQLGIGRRKRTLVQYDYRHPTNRVVLLCQTHVGRVPSRTGQVADGKRKKRRTDNERSSLPNADSQVRQAYHGLDGIFDDAEAWGVETLKGWIDDYEAVGLPPLTAIRQSSRASTIWSVWKMAGTKHP